MKTTIEVEGIKVSFNKEGILREIDRMVYDKEKYTAESAHNEDDTGYSISEKEFEKIKKAATKYVTSLNETKLETLGKSSMKINKNGKLHKSASNIAYDIGNTHSYDDYYGSHNYKTSGLQFMRTGDKSATLQLTDYINHQDSF